LFAEHAVGGVVGLLLNAFFADKTIIALDGVSTTADGGFMNHNYALLYKQVCYVLATTGYTFVVTALIAKGVDAIPGLRLRAGPVAETLGMDEVEVGSFAFPPKNRY
jgi:Amt family ammonium transporter